MTTTSVGFGPLGDYPVPVGGGPRPASIVVAPAGASAAVKGQADVVCTGTDDMQLVASAYYAHVGLISVLLLPGEYYDNGHANFSYEGTLFEGFGANINLAGVEFQQTYLGFYGENSLIRGLTVRATGPAYSCGGIRVWGDKSRAELCSAYGQPSVSNLYFGMNQSAADAIVENCYVEGAVIGYEVDGDRGKLLNSQGFNNGQGAQCFGPRSLISGNVLTGTKMTGTSFDFEGDGIYLDDYAEDSIATGNIISSHYVGIDSFPVRAIIADNIVELSSSAGMDVTGHSAKVTGNHVSGSAQARTNSGDATQPNIVVGGADNGLPNRQGFQSVTGNTSRPQTLNASGIPVGTPCSTGLDVTNSHYMFTSHNDLRGSWSNAARVTTGAVSMTVGQPDLT